MPRRRDGRDVPPAEDLAFLNPREPQRRRNHVFDRSSAAFRILASSRNIDGYPSVNRGMSTSSLIGSAATAAVLTAAIGGAVRTSTSKESSAARHVVVAELFTSEGCSSCPPADALLQQITSSSPIDGVEVLGLEEHVDYWDRLGWRDPFSSATFSNRQAEYAVGAFRFGQLYTPQLVVDGAFEAVGSDRRNVRAAILAAAGRPAASVSVTATAIGDRAKIEVAVEVPPQVERTSTANVLVAIVEDGLATSVKRGENRNRTLPHSAVVRSLSAVGSLPLDASGRFVRVDLPLAPEWRTPQLRVVGFVQERAGLRILGANSAGLGALPGR